MKAWQLAAPGPVEKTMKLRDDVPRPDPQKLGEQEVLVQVAAASLNPSDHKLPGMGILARAVLHFPITVGMDFSGKVTTVGSRVADVRVGDWVVGRVDPRVKSPGTLREYITVDRADVAVLPADSAIDPVHAAGLGTAALTAYQTIAPYVREGQGDRVFINGGSGGVGTLGIQVAKQLGCHVTVTCSTAKAELCRELGADDIIDYKTISGNLSDELRKKAAGRAPFRLIVDNVGNTLWDLYFSSDDYLAEGGPYVYVGSKPSLDSLRAVLVAKLLPRWLGGARAPFVAYLTENKQHDLEVLTRWAAEGRMKLIVDKVFEFEEAKTAMEYVKKGSSSGKNIVKVQEL
ncbi:Zinc-type alcohol dehydrogenase-like protein-like protein [Hapsidospora chrysogenum ATCC 11550]|uniref:Zinc-type alcohol dehydrogenase-like protein-like protein n=1 Tax=Hapsidospora chrysogenum (strain ATCC 11550 / CBS 779.69 / DSM 880 / IAM 14645 / JCM 23072 / IMI 49137) TaxID=857340 RepID=A0A086SUX0_HAPC1|nr:Zinc-type alcohol dehydrogenase-like protein-like protein [Hapsidospora chrysogenum ATCC 11550]